FILSNDPDVRRSRDVRARSAKPNLSVVNGKGGAPRTDATGRRKGPFLDKPIGKPDDLTRITGIGPKLSSDLNEIGVFHLWQIAAWSETEAKLVDEKLSAKGRIGRDRWVEQARMLSAQPAAGV